MAALIVRHIVPVSGLTLAPWRPSPGVVSNNIRDAPVRRSLTDRGASVERNGEGAHRYAALH
jgi:hypothetical protein